MKIKSVYAEPQPFDVTLRIETAEDVKKLANFAQENDLVNELKKAVTAKLKEHGLTL